LRTSPRTPSDSPWDARHLADAIAVTHC
jgi:hypothetical protein